MSQRICNAIETVSKVTNDFVIWESRANSDFNMDSVFFAINVRHKLRDSSYR
jgi:hypothetical protein